MKSRILSLVVCGCLLGVFACNSDKGSGLPKNISKADPNAKMSTAPTPPKPPGPPPVGEKQ
jgi:hypothetical protein